MYKTLDERYLDWLYSLIAPVSIRNPARSYRHLCDHLFKKPFHWFLPNDDNRIEDGRELRNEFLDEFVVDDDEPGWIDLEVSVLEVLIALARRGAFETGEPVDLWFWKFIDNLDLREFTDAKYVEDHWEDVDDILDVFIERRYDRLGIGGVFPLRKSKQNQRKVEIWYQMAAYLLENYEF